MAAAAAPEHHHFVLSGSLDRPPDGAAWTLVPGYDGRPTAALLPGAVPCGHWSAGRSVTRRAQSEDPPSAPAHHYDHQRHRSPLSSSASTVYVCVSVRGGGSSCVQGRGRRLGGMGAGHQPQSGPPQRERRGGEERERESSDAGVPVI